MIFKREHTVFSHLSVIMVLATVLMSMLLAGGCGYRFAGASENRLSSRDTVWVDFIRNSTVSTIAQTAMRRAVLDEIHAMRGMMPAGSPEEGDLHISGVLTAYSTNAASYSSIDNVREYRIDVAVQFEARRKGEKKPFWKGTVQAYQDYPVFSDLAFQSNAADAALVAASRKIAGKLVTALESNY